MTSTDASVPASPAAIAAARSSVRRRAATTGSAAALPAPSMSATGAVGGAAGAPGALPRWSRPMADGSAAPARRVRDAPDAGPSASEVCPPASAAPRWPTANAMTPQTTTAPTADATRPRCGRDAGRPRWRDERRAMVVCLPRLARPASSVRASTELSGSTIGSGSCARKHASASSRAASLSRGSGSVAAVSRSRTRWSSLDAAPSAPGPVPAWAGASWASTTLASAYTSPGGPQASPRRTSGAANPGVPALGVRAPSRSTRTGRPSRPMTMFAGDTSPWTRPAACSASSASASGTASVTASPALSGPRADRSAARVGPGMWSTSSAATPGLTATTSRTRARCSCWTLRSRSRRAPCRGSAARSTTRTTTRSGGPSSATADHAGPCAPHPIGPRTRYPCVSSAATTSGGAADGSMATSNPGSTPPRASSTGPVRPPGGLPERDGAMLPRRLARGIEHRRGPHGIPRVDRHRPTDGEPAHDRAIEVGGGTGRARDRDALCPTHEPALVRLAGVVVLGVRDVVHDRERRRLGLERRHEVGPRVAQHTGARTGRPDQCAGLQVAVHLDSVRPCGVLQGEEHVVVDGRRERAKLGVDGDDGTEQLDCRVDEVRAEIEQQTARDDVELLPAMLRDGTPPLPAPLEGVDVAELPRVEHPAERELFGVPSAVLEDRQPAAVRLRGACELSRVVGGGSERLVDDDGQTRLERSVDVGHVRARGARDDDEVELGGTRQHGRDVGVDDDAGPVGPRCGRTARVAHDDVSDPLTDLAQQARMLTTPRRPVPDQPDTQRVAHVIHHRTASSRPSGEDRSGSPTHPFGRPRALGHHVRRPTSCTSAGTSRLRTIRVSISTPNDTMNASWARNSSGMTPSAANVAARTTPAEVMTPPVTARPRSTPSRVSTRRLSSRTRVMRKIE